MGFKLLHGGIGFKFRVNTGGIGSTITGGIEFKLLVE